MARHRADEHVGRRIRQRRWILGVSQQQLAVCVGVKFQQIQKYESGDNRVSASRLWDISEALGVSVEFFFEGLERPSAASDFPVPEAISDREALELLRAYYAIPEAARRRLLDLTRALGQADSHS